MGTWLGVFSCALECESDRSVIQMSAYDLAPGSVGAGNSFCAFCFLFCDSCFRVLPFGQSDSMQALS